MLFGIPNLSSLHVMDELLLRRRQWDGAGAKEPKFPVLVLLCHRGGLLK